MDNEEKIKEKKIVDCPDLISFESTQKILKQMENCVCKIKINDEQGTGFFCEIPFPDKNNKKKVLITNNHIIDKEILDDEKAQIEIDIKKETKIKILNPKDRINYTKKKYDITIIELKESDEINDFLELDDKLIDDIINDINNEKGNHNKDYIDQTIYIIQYPDSKLSVSYGILINIYTNLDFQFRHNSSTRFGSSGSPILNLNNKIIGIHKENMNKNNYNLGSFLNYALKEFVKKYYYGIVDSNQELLDDFNDKYKTEFTDTLIEEMDFKNHSIGSKGLESLSKIEFSELKQLKLSENNIKAIKYLKDFKYDNLEVLDLSSNKISNISVLGEIELVNLRKLNLGNNQIENIDVLENAKFDKLELLNLNKNQIYEIKSLGKINLKNLKELNLGSNDISSEMDSFKSVKVKNLTKLTLSKTKISNLLPLIENKSIEKLEELFLFDNKISDISKLINCNFPKLKILNLKKNHIKDIRVLEKVNFIELKELSLENNQIEDINRMANFNFPKLEKLGLSNNKISDINILEKVNFKELKILYLSNNPISDISIFNKVLFGEDKKFDLEKLTLRKTKFDKNKNKELLDKLKTRVKNEFQY